MKKEKLVDPWQVRANQFSTTRPRVTPVHCVTLLQTPSTFLSEILIVPRLVRSTVRSLGYFSPHSIVDSARDRDYRVRHPYRLRD